MRISYLYERCGVLLEALSGRLVGRIFAIDERAAVRARHNCCRCFAVGQVFHKAFLLFLIARRLRGARPDKPVNVLGRYLNIAARSVSRMA